MSKYARLQDHLRALDADEWRPTFGEVECVLGFTLPSSARAHPAWSANNRDHSYSSAWLDAGWHTEDLSLTAERITFRRVRKRAGGSSPQPTGANGSTSASASAGASPFSWDTADKLDYQIGMQWTPIGRVVLDQAGRLGFPKAPPAPGLYRLRIRRGGGEEAYFGETDNLIRRFGNYRKPGPTQQTSLRINAKLKADLAAGAEVAVATVTSQAWIERAGAKITADLASKAVRRMFENAAIIEGGGADVKSLNR
jgi:hypothetical protein